MSHDPDSVVLTRLKLIGLADSLNLDRKQTLVAKITASNPRKMKEDQISKLQNQDIPLFCLASEFPSPHASRVATKKAAHHVVVPCDPP